MTDSVHKAKALSHPKRVLKLLQGDNTDFPVTVHIGPMAGCNHDCVWCSDREYRKKYPGYLPKDAFLPILLEMANGGVESVVWIGSGEPTFHPQFPALVAYAAQVGLKQGLVTNGSRLPLEHVQKFSWIRVSLDAGVSATHKSLHVVSDYDVVMANVQKAAATKGDTVIGVSFLVCNENKAELPALVKLLDSWGVDYIQIKRLTSTPVFTAIPSDERFAFETETLKVIDDHVADGEGGNAGLPCWASSLNTVIAPTGDLFLCCRLSNTDRDEEAWIGNLWKDGGFKAVWLGERRDEVAKRFLDPEVTKSCPTCWMTPFNEEIDKLARDRFRRQSLLFI